MNRDLYCGDIRKEHVGRNLTVTGWVARRRDLGALIFVELRDRSGSVQILFNPQISEETHLLAKTLRPEFVVSVTGSVVERAEATLNRNQATGEVEIVCTSLKILNEAKTPPFPVEDDVQVSDDLRLKYRYLDLRRPLMQQNLMIRHKAVFAARAFLDEQGFVEIETPMLTRSTPEGARDYLVPSRVNPGKFYALPQSPQLFKQLLMVSGFDRYMQIVKCFRDEDLRAERQPEFTQIDLEMSFVERADVIALVEPLLQRIFASAGVSIEVPFPQLTYDDAMDQYGSDKPDLRYGCAIQDLTEWARGTDFKIFQQAEMVKGIAAFRCGRYSRKELELLEAKAKELGAAGLIWVKRSDHSFQSSILKVVGEEKLKIVWNQMGAGETDLLLLVAGPRMLANSVLGQLRIHLARMEKWYGKDDFRLAWIIDFPLFEFDPEENRYVACHHPFTSPVPDSIPLLDKEPGKAKAQAYDVVCNGYEIGGGSIRIHNADVQSIVFDTLKISRQEAKEKFGFLLEALQYGAPPHGGIAFGVDRISMLLAGEESIREVIAFPKTSTAQCLMTDSPSTVSKRQLEDLHIRLIDDQSAK